MYRLKCRKNIWTGNTEISVGSMESVQATAMAKIFQGESESLKGNLRDTKVNGYVRRLQRILRKKNPRYQRKTKRDFVLEI